MPLLRKVDAVVGQGDVPLSGVSEADAQMLRQRPAESGKGMGIVNELLAGHPHSQGHRRWGDEQDPTSIQRKAEQKPLLFQGFAPVSSSFNCWSMRDMQSSSRNVSQYAFTICFNDVKDEIVDKFIITRIFHFCFTFPFWYRFPLIFY